MRKIKIGNREISEESPIFFISEIGINHNGSVSLAKQLIDLAKICGSDAVKFQKRTPEICVPEHEKNKMRETPWGEMTYFDYKKKIEFGKEEYDEIDKYCKEKGILWTASVWDIPSFEFLKSYDPPFYKVSSAKITDRNLLERIRDTGKPVILSTGGTNLEKIKLAIEIFKGNNNIAILHCNSGYPAKDNELNLKVIESLKEGFPDLIVGYSGHEEGISASLVAASLGAKIIERHITLNRAMWGTDQSASIEFSGLRRLIRDLKKLRIWKGDGNKIVYDTEKKIMNKLRDKDTL